MPFEYRLSSSSSCAQSKILKKNPSRIKLDANNIIYVDD